MTGTLTQIKFKQHLTCDIKQKLDLLLFPLLRKMEL